MLLDAVEKPRDPLKRGVTTRKATSARKMELPYKPPAYTAFSDDQSSDTDRFPKDLDGVEKTTTLKRRAAPKRKMAPKRKANLKANAEKKKKAEPEPEEEFKRYGNLPTNTKKT